MASPLALIVGVGDGLSASLARRLAAADYQLVLAARNVDGIAALAAETGGETRACDATDPGDVADLFGGLDGRLSVAIYNPSMRVAGPVAELDPEKVRAAIDVTAFGAFLCAQQAARIMLAQEPEDGARGTILFTGASAGMKGFARSAPFAMGKFAERGLAESMVRELHPQGVHVALVHIDGAINNPGRSNPADNPDALLDPDAIADTYMHVIGQHRSAWTSEVALRPWVENF